MSLADIAPGHTVTVESLGGERSFRRRLMELGLLPGTAVSVLRVAPLGDPIQLSVRGCHLSIRRQEASAIAIRGQRDASSAASSPAASAGEVARAALVAASAASAPGLR